MKRTLFALLFTASSLTYAADLKFKCIDGTEIKIKQLSISCDNSVYHGVCGLAATVETSDHKQLRVAVADIIPQSTPCSVELDTHP